jgi:hypothetical protein
MADHYSDFRDARELAYTYGLTFEDVRQDLEEVILLYPNNYHFQERTLRLRLDIIADALYDDLGEIEEFSAIANRSQDEIYAE